MSRAGIVTVAGKPNAGKSTLLNRIVGQKLSITSPKPQSTRDRIVGIRTENDVQMVLFDTPGLLEPQYALQEAMKQTALRALADADVILYMADATEGVPDSLQHVSGAAIPATTSVVTVLNKADFLTRNAHQRLVEECPDAFLISAARGDGVDNL